MFGRKLVTCDDFEDDNDEVVVPIVDFIGRRSICYQLSLSARGILLIGTPSGDINSRVADLIVDAVERKSGVQLDGSRVGGVEFMASVVLDDSTVDVISSIHMHFVPLLKYWMSNST